ncbi:hypothetical protein Tco_1255507 [Tanacetum coccineum]
MLVQPTQDEGASSERLSNEQLSPSPATTSEVPNESLPDLTSTQPSEVSIEHQPVQSPRPSPTPIVPDSIPEPTGENLRDHSSNDISVTKSSKLAMSFLADKKTLESLIAFVNTICVGYNEAFKLAA